MPRINVETQKLEYEIRSTPARLHVQTVRPEMRISRTPIKLNVERKLPTFRVDWSRIRAESGLAPPEQMVRKFRDEGNSRTQEAITRISGDGDRLMRIENKNDSIAQLVRDREEERTRTEVNIASMPQSSPNIEWEHGYINMEWTLPELQIEWELGRVEMSCEPHSVEVIIKQYPHVKITVVDDEVIRASGRRVDRKI